MTEGLVSAIGGDDRLSDDDFRRRAFQAAQSIGSILQATYGPYGMDKLVVDHVGTGYVTNQGSKILEELDVENPVAGMLVDACNFSDRYADGSTFATLFACELLDEAGDLIEEGLSPVDVVRGFDEATGTAVAAMDDVAVPLELTERELYALAASATATSGSFSDDQIEHLRRVVLDTAGVLAPEVTLDDVHFEEAIRLDVESSRVIQGTILRSDPPRAAMPDDVVDADVLLLSEGVTTPDVDALGDDTEVSLSGVDAVSGAVDSTHRRLRERVQAIKDSGADVVIVEGRLDNAVVSELTSAGILAVHQLEAEKFERAHQAVGGTAVLPEQIEAAELGYSGRVTVTDLGSGTIKGIVVADCPDTTTTSIVLNAGTASGAGLAKRTITQGIGALAAAYEDPRAVPGGGATEVTAARAVRAAVADVQGPGQLAAEAYADALETTVAHLVRNAGQNPLDALPKVKTAHADGADDAAVDLATGDVVSTYETGVIDPIAVKRNALTTAADYAASLVRIDGLLHATDGESSEIEDLDQMSPTPSGTWGK